MHKVRKEALDGRILVREDIECGGIATWCNPLSAAQSGGSVPVKWIQNVVVPSCHMFGPGSSHCKNRRSRTLLTSPSIRKNERMLEPP